MVQCLDAAKQGLNAQLVIEGAGEKLMLRAFDKVLESIAEKCASDVSMSSLHKAKPFAMV